MRTALNKSDWLFISLLLFIVFIYSFAFRFTIPPFEDAAMLMRYAQHIADGYGIVWNIGDKPVDGATDFLFMIVLASLVKAGMTLEFAVRFIGIVSHVVTVLIIYIAIRKLYNANRWLAFVPAFYFAIGPGLAYTEAGFGASFFTLIICLTWIQAIRISDGNNSNIISLLFALLALTAALIRPEGVFLSMLFLGSVVYAKGFRQSLKQILYFSLTFATVGTAYFLWHWNYFGDPLPNPFYVKGGGYFHLRGLTSSIGHALMLLGPFTLAYLLALRSGSSTRKAIFSLIPIFGFVLVWALMKNEMNYLMRYQYPILGIALISFVPMIKDISSERNLPSLNALNLRSRIIIYAIGILVLCGIGYYSVRKYSSQKYIQDGIYDAAIVLKKYSGKNYTMAVSEAGILPLYSGWKAIDTYGLNDQWIAHHGGITEEYLSKYNPELIMFRALFSPLGMQIPSDKNKQWFNMTITLKSYAERNGYVLAASFGDTPYDTHNYYVRTDFPESKEIVKTIRAIPYGWDTGKPAVNFALYRTLSN